MLYAEAIEALQTLGAELAGTRRKFELQHMRTLMSALGDAQSLFPCVLIAGTNGKGSTAATLASILNASGYRTGLYTSPHLLQVKERIQISEAGPAGAAAELRMIADERFAALLTQVLDAATTLVAERKLPQLPSYFETLTAMAFLAFAERNVEIAVLEVGLGGRLDATNIVEPLASVITDISLDHTEWLGNTITEIAREKAGILRAGGVLITLPQHPEANAAIGEQAVALDVTGINAAAYLPQPSPREQVLAEYPVTAFGTVMHVEPGLPGEHQRRNLALALAAADFLREHRGFTKIAAETAAAGVRQVRWPGRLERSVLPGGAHLLIDVAHNPAGMWTLRSYLSRCFETSGTPDFLASPRTLVFSALADKAVEEMAQVLFPLFDGPGDRVLLVQVESARAATKDRLAALASEHGEGAAASYEVLPSVATAYDAVSLQRAGSVVVAGSIYLAGEWKQAMPAEAQERLS